MKPLGVLVLVLVAVGGLFFALNQLGGKAESSDQPTQAVENTAVIEQPANDTTELASPKTPGREEGVIQAPAGERVVLAPKGDEQFDNILSGLILSTTQEPIAGASVVLTRGGLSGRLFVNEQVDRSQDRSTITNGDGKYIFANVEPFDRYSIEATAEGYSRGDLPSITVDSSVNLDLPPIMLSIGASLSGIIRDGSGSPVPGVALRLDGIFARMDGQPADDSLSTLSDDVGHYLIANVPPGNRSLYAAAEGYANQSKGGLVFRGEEPLTMDMTLELAEMICGRVISSAGKPIGDARVLAVSFSNSNRQCRDETRTDEAGAFCLTHVTVGAYTLAVSAPAFRPKNENRVKSGTTSLIIELQDQGMVSGRVVAGDGPTPEQYQVQLRQTHAGVAVTTAVGKPLSFSDPEGAFSIECGQPGTFLIEATAPGFAPSYSAEFRFNIGQPMNGVVVNLTGGGSLSGLVVDPEGKPIARPRVTTHDNTWSNNLFDRALGDQFPTNITRAAITGNGEGKFLLSSLRPDTYQLRIRAPGFCEKALKDLVVTDGKDNFIGAIQLIRGGGVSGTVIDLAGRPVAAATVRLGPSGQGGLEAARNYETTTGVDGNYTIQNVLPGAYNLSASPSNGVDNFLGAFVGAQGNLQPVQISDGQSQHFELKIDS